MDHEEMDKFSLYSEVYEYDAKLNMSFRLFQNSALSRLMVNAVDGKLEMFMPETITFGTKTPIDVDKITRRRKLPKEGKLYYDVDIGHSCKSEYVKCEHYLHADTNGEYITYFYQSKICFVFENYIRFWAMYSPLYNEYGGILVQTDKETYHGIQANVADRFITIFEFKSRDQIIKTGGYLGNSGVPLPYAYTENSFIGYDGSDEDALYDDGFAPIATHDIYCDNLS